MEDEARYERVEVPGGSLFVRTIGDGNPVLVLHGGPEFDHTYLVPGIDVLADDFRLIAYDQRGRGRSDGDPEAIDLNSEIEDLDRMRRHLGLEKIALIGHSWGGILGAAYVIAHPNRVSHLVLMNSAPLTFDGYQRTREKRRALVGEHAAQLDAIAAAEEFARGDPEALAQYCSIVFRKGVFNPASLDRLDFTFSGHDRESILRSRRIEERLAAETYSNPAFDLLEDLGLADVRTLVLHGDEDFVPVGEAEAIAAAVPRARLTVIPQCGHFAFVEHPEAVRREIVRFLSEV